MADIATEKSGDPSGDARTKRAKRNILVSGVMRGLSILVSFLIVPITIDYLNTARYGVWITLSTIVGWLNFFDLGLGNGLKNKLAEALAKGDSELAKVYVSTAYAIISLMTLAMLASVLLVTPLVDWRKVLNLADATESELTILALIVFSFFCLRFIFQLVSIVLAANQNNALESIYSFLGSAISLVVIFLITKMTPPGSLVNVGAALAGIPVVILFFASIMLYSRSYRFQAPSFSYVRWRYARDLFGIGAKFFVISIAGVILYSTSNLIITQLFGPAEVTPYNLAQRYFGIITMVFGIISAPLWSAHTEAFVKKEFDWIKSTNRRFIRVWFVLVALGLVMLLLSPQAYRAWIGNRVYVPFMLSLMMFLYVVLYTFGGIFVICLNGMGKVQVQLISAVVGMVLFIPLSIVFAKTMNLGIPGVILATIVCNINGPVLAPIQYYLVINNKARGIWVR